jgi:replicative DNA helicase
MSEDTKDPRLEAAEYASLYLVAAVLDDPARLDALDDVVLANPNLDCVLASMRRLAAEDLPLDFPHVLDATAKVSRRAAGVLKSAMSMLQTFDVANFDEHRTLVVAWVREMQIIAAAREIAHGAKNGEPLGSALAELERAVSERDFGTKSHDLLGGDWFGSGGSGIVPLWGTVDQCAWADGEGFMLCGRQGVGKTTIFGQLLFAFLGLIEPVVLGMPVTPVGRVGYIAADRPKQIKRAHSRLWLPEHAEALNEQLVVHEGPFEEDLATHPEQLVRWALANRLEVVFIDSLKDLAVKLSDDAVGANLNRAFQLVVREGINLGMNHHQTKRNADGREPDSLADVYGSNWITSGLGSVIYLGGNPGDPLVKVKHLKQPSGPIDVGGLMVEHDHHTGLSRVESQVDPLRELRRATMGLTARQMSQLLLSKTDPSNVETKRATRELDRLVRAGLAVKNPGQRGGASGGQASVYFAATHEEEPIATALQHSEDPF